MSAGNRFTLLDDREVLRQVLWFCWEGRGMGGATMSCWWYAQTAFRGGSWSVQDTQLSFASDLRSLTLSSPRKLFAYSVGYRTSSDRIFTGSSFSIFGEYSNTGVTRKKEKHKKNVLGARSARR